MIGGDAGAGKTPSSTCSSPTSRAAADRKAQVIDGQRADGWRGTAGRHPSSVPFASRRRHGRDEILDRPALGVRRGRAVAGPVDAPVAAISLRLQLAQPWRCSGTGRASPEPLVGIMEDIDWADEPPPPARGSWPERRPRRRLP